ncbi:MAG TPA: phosphatase PAP2 family protein [Puia sp.]|nr:phosphatase PAP2 family protein [Puia sp.]
MPKQLPFFIALLFRALSVLSQDTPVYHINPKVDIPLFAATAGWTFYGFAQISKKEPTSQTTIMNLQKSDIPWFDRWADRPYNKNVDKISYLPFDAAMPYPIVFIALDKKMRKDFFKLCFLYAESMAITGALYTSAVHYFSRLRPLTYRSESPMDTRTSSNSRNSFFAGHVALVATSTFFMASAYADYHPDSKLKWVMYGAAGAATLVTGYLRNRAGEHFPSDILVGTVVGTMSGLLTPRLHQTKLIRNQRLTILPFAGRSQGLALLYKL